MRIPRKEMQEKVVKFVSDLNEISFQQIDKGENILGDFIEILEGKTYDQVCRELGDMSTSQMCNLAEILLCHLLKMRNT